MAAPSYAEHRSGLARKIDSDRKVEALDRLSRHALSEAAEQMGSGKILV
jgi:predicted transcriptional regulator